MAEKRSRHRTDDDRRRFLMRTAQLGLAAGGAAIVRPGPSLARVVLKMEPFALSSAAFQNGQAIPKRHSCDGADASPPLSWLNGPGTALSFALVCYDPDAPGHTFYHWGIFDLTPGRQLKEGFPIGATAEGARQALNDFGVEGYKGPCPPQGHGVHHYHFEVYALKVANLDLPDRVRCDALLTAARDQELARAELVGLYSR